VAQQFTKVKLLQPRINPIQNPGLKYSYYEFKGKLKKLPNFSLYKAKTNDITQYKNLNMAERDIDFMIKFEKMIEIFKDGIYTFYSESDDAPSYSFMGNWLLIMITIML